MNKLIGWRTPDRALSQPEITIVYEDEVTWHETRGGGRHVEDYRLLPDGYTYLGSSINGLWAVALTNNAYDSWYCRRHHDFPGLYVERAVIEGAGIGLGCVAMVAAIVLAVAQ